MTARLRSIFRRHIALPQDHGSWVFILSPLLIGLFAAGKVTLAAVGLTRRGNGRIPPSSAGDGGGSWIFTPFLLQWLETLWGIFHPAVGVKPTHIGICQLIVSLLFALVFIVTWRL